MAKARRRRLTSMGAFLRDIADEGSDFAREEFRTGIRDFTESRASVEGRRNGSPDDDGSGGDDDSRRSAGDSRRGDSRGSGGRDDGRRDDVGELRDAVEALSRKIDELAEVRSREEPDG